MVQIRCGVDTPEVHSGYELAPIFLELFSIPDTSRQDTSKKPVAQLTPEESEKLEIWDGRTVPFSAITARYEIEWNPKLGSGQYASVHRV